MGWELVINGEAAGRCSATTEGLGSSSSLQPRAGLNLGVFWAASSVWCSDQLWMRAAAMQRRLFINGDMYTSTTVAVTL